MNIITKNNYVQYVTSTGNVKTKEVVLSLVGTNSVFTLEGILEEFFITSVFQNNCPVYGLGFENLENDDMLSFINSPLVDIGSLPKQAFLPPSAVVVLSYDNAYNKEFHYLGSSTLLNREKKYVIKDLTESGLFGGVIGESVISKYLIPANTFKYVDLFRIEDLSMNVPMNYNDNQFLKLSVNNIDSLVGSSKLAESFAIGDSFSMSISLVLVNGVLKGNENFCSASQTMPYFNDFSNGVWPVVPFDVTVDNYFFVSVICNTLPNVQMSQRVMLVTN